MSGLVEGHASAVPQEPSTKPALAAEGNYELPQDLVSPLSPFVNPAPKWSMHTYLALIIMIPTEGVMGKPMALFCWELIGPHVSWAF